MIGLIHALEKRYYQNKTQLRYNFGSVYVKIRYENFHYSVIVDNMKEDCVLLEKLRKFQRVVHVLCALCAPGFKKDTNCYARKCF